MTTEEVIGAAPLEIAMAAKLGEIGRWEPRAQAYATVRLLRMYKHDLKDWTAARAKEWVASLKGG